MSRAITKLAIIRRKQLLPSVSRRCRYHSHRTQMQSVYRTRLTESGLLIKPRRSNLHRLNHLSVRLRRLLSSCTARGRRKTIRAKSIRWELALRARKQHHRNQAVKSRSSTPTWAVWKPNSAASPTPAHSASRIPSELNTLASSRTQPRTTSRPQSVYKRSSSQISSNSQPKLRRWVARLPTNRFQPKRLLRLSN